MCLPGRKIFMLHDLACRTSVHCEAHTLRAVDRTVWAPRHDRRALASFAHFSLPFLDPVSVVGGQATRCVPVVPVTPAGSDPPLLFIIYSRWLPDESRPEGQYQRL